MLKLKLVLFAIFLIIGCVAALGAAQGEAKEIKTFAERQGREWHEHHWHEASSEGSSSDNSETSESTDDSAPTTRPAEPTTRPTRPTTRPSEPSTKPTTKPTEPTTRPTTKPTSKPTAAPTSRPHSTSAAAASSAASSGSSTTGSSTSSVGLCDLVPTTSEPLKILVPLYVYPGSDWDTVASAASEVEIIAIINPNSGPDPSGPDSSYVTYMSQLASAGVQMIGYVYTSYGERAISDVEADIDTYTSLYTGITGIFFDEGSPDASEIAFYTQAYNYVMSKGLVHSIINPGVQPDEGYLAITTSIVIFEDQGALASTISYSSWVTCASDSTEKSGYKYKFSGIGHTTAEADASGIISTFESQGIGMIYVTDGAAGCCTYNTLTSYFATEASTVASVNA